MSIGRAGIIFNLRVLRIGEGGRLGSGIDILKLKEMEASHTLID